MRVPSGASGAERGRQRCERGRGAHFFRVEPPAQPLADTHPTQWPPFWPPSCGRPSRRSGASVKGERMRGEGDTRRSWPLFTRPLSRSPSLKNSSEPDRLAFAVHAWMLGQSYKLVAVGQAADGENRREREERERPTSDLHASRSTSSPRFSLHLSQPSRPRTRPTRPPRAGTRARRRARTRSGTWTTSNRRPAPARRPW